MGIEEHIRLPGGGTIVEIGDLRIRRVPGADTVVVIVKDGASHLHLDADQAQAAGDWLLQHASNIRQHEARQAAETANDAQVVAA